MDVYEYRGRYVVATCRDGQYEAWFRRRHRAAGGAYAVVGSLSCVATHPWVATYATPESARRALNRSEVIL